MKASWQLYAVIIVAFFILARGFSLKELFF